MSESASEDTKYSLTITFDPKNFTVKVDGKVLNPFMGIAMLEEALREVKFTWNVQRAVEEQQNAIMQAKVQRLVQRA